MRTPAERYEKLIKRLGGTNADIGEMQSIARDILAVGLDSAADYLDHFTPKTRREAIEHLKQQAEESRKGI